MSREHRLARLEAALPTDDGRLCLPCRDRQEPGTLRRTLDELRERAETEPDPCEGMSEDQVTKYLDDLQAQIPPCTRCGYPKRAAA